MFVVPKHTLFARKRYSAHAVQCGARSGVLAGEHVRRLDASPAHEPRDATGVIHHGLRERLEVALAHLPAGFRPTLRAQSLLVIEEEAVGSVLVDGDEAEGQVEVHHCEDWIPKLAVDAHKSSSPRCRGAS